MAYAIREEAYMGLHIKTDGSITNVTPRHGKKFSVEEIQALVGGYFELVHAVVGTKRRNMYVNEEGLIHNLPLNHTATSYVAPHFIGAVHGGVLRGNVLITDKGEG